MQYVYMVAMPAIGLVALIYFIRMIHARVLEVRTGHPSDNFWRPFGPGIWFFSGVVSAFVYLYELHRQVLGAGNSVLDAFLASVLLAAVLWSITSWGVRKVLA